MRIHFIAIGGAIIIASMALQKQGHSVSGSDDKMANPAKTNLANAGILPDSIGFFEEK